MRLLVDQNLSFRLVTLLGDQFPQSVHARSIGLARALDEEVWAIAKSQGLTIVTKDADFHQLSLVKGHPPKVIWVRLGNASTDMIAALLGRHLADIEAFAADPEAAFLALG